MKLKRLLFSLVFMTIFLLSGLGYSQGGQQGSHDLSYTQDQTWFRQKRGKSEVSQSGDLQPWRQASWDERINLFIESLRKGDNKAFLYVEYGLLGGYDHSKGYPTSVGKHVSEGVIQKLKKEAKEKNTKIENVLTGGDPNVRKNVITGTLSGLFNKDPRVRLVAVNFLRRLKPDASMARDVKRALLLETATTERSKWREKDIDIPSIENPRLGWNTVYSSGGTQTTPLGPKGANKFGDGSGEEGNNSGGILNGNGRGMYLERGLYERNWRNDYIVTFTDKDHSSENIPVATSQVWTKASLLRYGADEHESGLEIHYGYKRPVEEMPKYLYKYIEAPDAGSVAQESVINGYHSVWEEMKKLDLFVTRAVWSAKVKGGDVNALRIISKDTFRALADQIDGESLSRVPMALAYETVGNPAGKDFFDEPEARAVIVGMLENRVVSTRETCIRWLRRLFERSQTSVATKREIKKALREARRRELLIDTIRGRHVHQLLVVTVEPDNWWGERDEIDTSSWANEADRVKNLQIYRNQVEFPEESATDIIYHDRRRPGQEEDDDDAPKKEATTGKTETTATTTKSSTTKEDSAEKSTEKDGELEPKLSHPLLKYRTATLQRLEQYVALGDFVCRPGYERTAANCTGKDREKCLENAKKAFEDCKAPWSGKNAAKTDAETTTSKAPETTTPKATEDKTAPAATKDKKESDDDDDDDEPGQYPGVRPEKVESAGDRSYNARAYEAVRAIETLHSLLLGRSDDLLKVSYLDLQNALFILQHEMLRKFQSVNKAGIVDTGSNDFIAYLMAGTQSAASQGRRYHGHVDLGAELDRFARARANLNTLLAGIGKNLAGLEKQQIGIDAPTLQKYRKDYIDDKGYKIDDKNIDSDYSRRPPGRSFDKDLNLKGDSRRDASERSHGKYYGQGQGGFGKNYDQQISLEGQAGGLSAEGQEADKRKIELGYYNFPPQWRGPRSQMIRALLVALADKDPQKRLIIIHLLRRLIPEASMLQALNKLLREIETVDKRPYKYFDTIFGREGNDATSPVVIRRQEKIVGHELLKLQRFVVRRMLVNKIRGGTEPDFLKEIPKGSFLTLIIRIDAEWDPFRIPLRSPISRNSNGSNGMFFSAQDIAVIQGGLENRNFLIQRETARWIVSFYDINRTAGFIGAPETDSHAKAFVRAIKFAEKRDIVYYERNYIQWQYANDYGDNGLTATSRLVNNANLTIKPAEDQVGIPVGRIPVRVGSPSDCSAFRSIDRDRKKEFEDKYGRGIADKSQKFSDFTKGTGEIRTIYNRIETERKTLKSTFGDKTYDDEKDLDSGGQ
ncbi:MAG: hypothetical protein OEV44_02340 [Spirochaetota bacterium]|nr:hypothetical protein [Spirochaetota bacterium]